jgi:hypothetical protein
MLATPKKGRAEDSREISGEDEAQAMDAIENAFKPES